MSEVGGRKGQMSEVRCRRSEGSGVRGRESEVGKTMAPAILIILIIQSSQSSNHRTIPAFRHPGISHSHTKPQKRPDVRGQRSEVRKPFSFPLGSLATGKSTAQQRSPHKTGESRADPIPPHSLYSSIGESDRHKVA